MTTLLEVEIVVLIVIVSLVWLFAPDWRPGHRMRTRPRLLYRHRVMLQMKNRESFDALLWEEQRHLVVLRDVKWRAPGRDPVSLDGEVVVEADRIEWIQVPPAPGGQK